MNVQLITSHIMNKLPESPKFAMILGSGLGEIVNRMKEASPSSLRFATFLYKPDVASKDLSIDWIGFNIDDHFVVGYGLDCKQIYRGLPGIYTLNKETTLK